MAEKGIRFTETSCAVVRDERNGFVKLEVVAPGGALQVRMSPDQARELARTLEAFAEIGEPQESEVL